MDGNKGRETRAPTQTKEWTGNNFLAFVPPWGNGPILLERGQCRDSGIEREREIERTTESERNRDIEKGREGEID